MPNAANGAWDVVHAPKPLLDDTIFAAAPVERGRAMMRLAVAVAYHRVMFRVVFQRCHASASP